MCTSCLSHKPVGMALHWLISLLHLPCTYVVLTRADVSLRLRMSAITKTAVYYVEHPHAYVHTCNATVVLFHGRFFNRHLIVSLWNSFAITYRSMVTSVLAANMLVRSPPPDFTTLQAFGRPYSLVFLNLAANENLLSGNEESMRDLHGVLSDIHSILADSGTLVIALPDFKPRLDLLSRESNKNSKRLQKVHGAV